MINNTDLSFSIDEFVQSLNIHDKVEQGKILYQDAMRSGKFVRADLGVFRKNDDQTIWHLQQDEDGKEYIVKSTSYDTPIDGEWSALPSRTGEFVTLAYREYPICNFTKAEYRYDDANCFASFLVKKAAQEKQKFIANLLKTLSFDTKVTLQKRFAAFRES